MQEQTTASGLDRTTILFAEDNYDLRQVTEVYLRMMGFAVVACEDGLTASQAFAETTPVDLLLTDLEMPRRSGLELAREVTKLRPSLPVVIVSGSILSAETQQEIQDRSWTFLSKPCRFPLLLSSIRGLLRPDRGEERKTFPSAPNPLSGVNGSSAARVLLKAKRVRPIGIALT